MSSKPLLRSTFLTPERNKIVQTVERMYSTTEMVYSGKKPMQMYCSIGGMGKSEIAARVAKRLKIELVDLSPTTAIGLCMSLWEHREHPRFVLDDNDKLSRSEECTNIMKMAFGPQHLVRCPGTKEILKNEDRRIYDDDRYDPALPPPTFPLDRKAGLIWNSNKDYTKPEAVSTEMGPHFQALVSRGLHPIWMPDDAQSLFDYLIIMIVTRGMLRGHPIGSTGPENGGFSVSVVNDVIRFLYDNATKLKEITPRAAWQLAMARRNDPYWEQMWRDQLLPRATHHIEKPERCPFVGKNRPADWEEDPVDWKDDDDAAYC